MRPSSLAVCALEFCERGSKVRFINAGFPRPIVSGYDGFAESLGDELGAAPLGWFHHRYPLMDCDMPEGYLYLWTDGLSDHAEKLDVDPLALADRLLRQKRDDDRSLYGATDDIAVVRLKCPGTRADAPLYIPVVSISIQGSELERIDKWQAYFESSMRLAIPDVDGGRLAEILLCLREALINALKYGCEQKRSKVAEVRIACSADGKEVKTLIVDPGTGHCFDVASHSARLADDTIAEHRGLMIMQSVPVRFQSAENGSRVMMDFSMN